MNIRKAINLLRQEALWDRVYLVGKHVLAAMATLAAIWLLAASLACAKPAPLPAPCPPPPTIQRPPLRIRQLPPNATTREVLEAYVLDLADQVGYADQLEALLDAYRTTPAPKETTP